ncbi:hypothetical protein P7M43_04610 [Vibrio parahaemolyticus]|nr:hypothetical protein [Vibrio parahaemolyticus]MDG2665823.1 hypothetical protein [Vibrio parahaemolyticus]
MKANLLVFILAGISTVAWGGTNDLNKRFEKLEELENKVASRESGNFSSYDYRNFLEVDYDKEVLIATTNSSATTTYYPHQPYELKLLENKFFLASFLIPTELDLIIKGKKSKLQISPLYVNDSRSILKKKLSHINTYSDTKLVKEGLPVTKDEALSLLNYLESVTIDLKHEINSSIFTASIGVSLGGYQRMYIRWEPESCEVKKTPEKVILKIEGQNVSFYAFCNAYTDSKGHYLNATPISEKGAKFVVDQFKKKTWVTIYGFTGTDVKEVKFWANGFTKAWDSAGGNAL